MSDKYSGNMTLTESYIRIIIATSILFYALYSGYIILMMLSLMLYYTAFKRFCFVYHLFNINERYSIKNYYLSLLPKYRSSPVYIFDNNGDVVFENNATKIIFLNILNTKDLNITNHAQIIQESISDAIVYEHKDRIYQVEIIGEAKEKLILAYFTDITDMKLYEQIAKQKEELDKLYEYDISQQKIAKEKLDSTFIDDLKNTKNLKSSIIYQASDILSGDFYSIHSLKNGATFVYVIDGQGHGISPALTVFAVSSAISHLIEKDILFEDIVDKLFPMIQKFLGEIEQLSYTMLYIHENTKEISYISGGMYPFMIKQDNKILTYKANNLPFMNFSPTPVISSVSVKNWDKILIYTDGLVEDLDEDMSEYSPIKILENFELFEKLKYKIGMKKYEDDITVVKIIKKSKDRV